VGEVLEADAFTRFRREGLFNAKVGDEFVAKILSGETPRTRPAFSATSWGRDPDLTALSRPLRP